MITRKWREIEWSYWNNDLSKTTYKVRFVQWVKARKLRIKELRRAYKND